MASHRFFSPAFYDSPMSESELSQLTDAPNMTGELWEKFFYDKEKLSAKEIAKLPPSLKGLYASLYDTVMESRERRQARIQATDRGMRRIERKLLNGEELNASEEKLFEEKGFKVSSIKATEVGVDAVDLLTDIVNGDYTLQDLHSIREGPEAAERKDAVENSPLQLFDNIIESAKEKTHEALKTKEPGHFFNSLEVELQNKMTPTHMTDAINYAATAIDLVQENQVGPNEAKEACDSYIKALALNEAEIKLKHVEGLANLNQSRHEATEEAASSGEAATKPAKKPQRPKNIAFDITDLNYDISFLPSDDPDVYKPLEIISYIGTTKGV